LPLLEQFGFIADLEGGIFTRAKKLFKVSKRMKVGKEL
jgi:hypothetical protein